MVARRFLPALLLPALLVAGCVQNAPDTSGPAAAPSAVSVRPGAGLIGTWRGTLVGAGANTGVTLRVTEQRPDGSGAGTWRGDAIRFTGSGSGLRFTAENQASVELTLTPEGTLAGSVSSNAGGGGRGRGARAVTLTRE